VLKCSLDGRIVGFFVIEARKHGDCFWSLNGLAPGSEGQGLGKRVWRSMLHWHRAAGVHTVSTSISSHNVAAFNLYVALGFRFPLPSMTLQWCPAGRLS
jgi:RimJ/RimL family protein N-acetyltransferase